MHEGLGGPAVVITVIHMVAADADGDLGINPQLALRAGDGDKRHSCVHLGCPGVLRVGRGDVHVVAEDAVPAAHVADDPRAVGTGDRAGVRARPSTRLGLVDAGVPRAPADRRRPGRLHLHAGRAGLEAGVGGLPGRSQRRLAAKILEAHGATDCCINAGGDVVAHGHPAPGGPRRVGIRHPLQPDRSAAVVGACDRLAIATSATYERGQRIIDPHTGEAADELASVTIIGPDLTTLRRRPCSSWASTACTG